MQDKNYCEVCDDLVDYYVKRKKEKYEIKDEVVEIISNIAVCRNCGTELFDIDLEDDNLQRAYSIYDRLKERKRRKAE